MGFNCLASWNQLAARLWSCVCWTNLAHSLLCQYLIVCCSAIVSCTSLSILSIGIWSTSCTPVALKYLSASTFYSYTSSLSVICSGRYWTRNTITCFVYSGVTTTCWRLTTLSSNGRSRIGLASYALSFSVQVRKCVTCFSNALVSSCVWKSVSLALYASISSVDFISKTSNWIAS